MHHSAQPILLFNRENPQNFKSPNGLRRKLDYIALQNTTGAFMPGGSSLLYYGWRGGDDGGGGARTVVAFLLIERANI